MLLRTISAVALFALVNPVSLGAATTPKATLPPQPQGTEVAFVRAIQQDLTERFPTPAAAEKAGYFRYTNEDEDGAISYANLHWESATPKDPSQLWYDVHGNLLGADFSVLQAKSPAPPKMWGVDARRWVSFREHVHYVLVGPNGKDVYGATGAEKFANAGGNVEDPKPETLVKMGIVKDGSLVKRVFLFPSVWDLIVWVKTNPNGAFADKNPLVTPSANAKSDEE